jgi:hypothetical protein
MLPKIDPGWAMKGDSAFPEILNERQAVGAFCSASSRFAADT